MDTDNEQPAVQIPSILLPTIADAVANADTVAEMKDAVRKQCLRLGLQNYKLIHGESAGSAEILELRQGVNEIISRIEKLVDRIANSSPPMPPGVHADPEFIAILSSDDPVAIWRFVTQKLNQATPLLR